jgi:hypothetical protein
VKADDEKVEKTETEIIEERRAARRAESAKAKAAQYAIDLKALDALEEKHGEGQVAALHVQVFVPGLPTMVIVKAPEGSAYKRFCDQVVSAKGNVQMKQAAAHVLARACIVYPDPALQASMLAAFPNMLNDAANSSAAFVQLQAEAEKKD